jgi:penicillin G amidase
VSRMLRWDGGMGVDSAEAAVYAKWSAKLGRAAYGELGARMDLGMVLEELTRAPNGAAMLQALREALAEGDKRMGTDEAKWRWGLLHRAVFAHSSGVKAWDLGSVEKPGDATTVNAASGANYMQTSGASYRQILDVADWDRSVTTNTPGESGAPSSAYYGNLLKEWASGGYHPLVYSRKAVEANTVERTTLRP